jgi:predicted membrane protein
MKKNDIFWGLLLILAAALIIVNQLGIFIGISFIEIIITVLLVGIIIKNIVRVSFPGILFPAAFLCIIYADEWNITQITPWPVLATALLGSIGLSMIFKSNKSWAHRWDKDYSKKWEKYVHTGESFDNVINEEDGRETNCSTSFGSTMKYINTDNFEKANIKCNFGAMKVYFDNAIIQNGSAEIFLDVSFSGVELFIPKTWKIVDKVNTSFGAMEEKNRRSDSTTPVVTIRGNVSFGGVEIVYI